MTVTDMEIAIAEEPPNAGRYTYIDHIYNPGSWLGLQFSWKINAKRTWRMFHVFEICYCDTIRWSKNVFRLDKN